MAIYKVECERGHEYTQQDDWLFQGNRPPYCCGACGSRAIRVWQVVTDTLTPVIKERLKEASLRADTDSQVPNGTLT